MKRFGSLLLFVFLVFFCSCDSPTAMEGYLAYQQAPFRMEVVAEGAEEVCFIAENDGESFLLTPAGEGMDPFSFVVKDGVLSLRCEDIAVPLSFDAGHLAATVYRMLTVDPSGTWQIVREKRDDGSVIRCDNGSVRLELDEKTGRPVRISGEGVEIQVLSFEAK